MHPKGRKHLLFLWLSSGALAAVGVAVLFMLAPAGDAPEPALEPVPEATEAPEAAEDHDEPTAVPRPDETEAPQESDGSTPHRTNEDQEQPAPPDGSMEPRTIREQEPVETTDAHVPDVEGVDTPTTLLGVSLIIIPHWVGPRRDKREQGEASSISPAIDLDMWIDGHYWPESTLFPDLL